MQAELPRTAQELEKLRPIYMPKLDILCIGGYLLHGSPSPSITLLEPRQAQNDQGKDGEPAVCATVAIWDAMFMALYNRAHLNPWSQNRAGWKHTAHAPGYFATANIIRAAQTATGHLYLVDPNRFEIIRGGPRSLTPVPVIGSIEFRIEDFPVEVEEIRDL